MKTKQAKGKKKTNRQANKTMQKNWTLFHSSERMYFGLKGNNDILRYSNFLGFLTCISLKPVDKTYF